jgi:hypothetical protein
MPNHVGFDEILNCLKRAQEIAKKEYNIENILQPGIIKELIIARILGHEIISLINTSRMLKMLRGINSNILLVLIDQKERHLQDVIFK